MHMKTTKKKIILKRRGAVIIEQVSLIKTSAAKLEGKLGKIQSK